MGLTNVYREGFTNLSIFVGVTVGERIRERREREKMSQAELAAESGVTAQTILNYEAGTRDPRSKELIRIAKALRTTVGWIIGEIDDPSPDALKKEIPTGSFRART